MLQLKRAKNIYRKNKADKTSAEIKHLIVNALRPIRFAQNTGYYFISGFDGKAVLFPVKPSLEGGNLYISMKNIELAETETVALKQGQYIKIIVQDEECGIDNAVLDRVFHLNLQQMENMH